MQNKEMIPVKKDERNFMLMPIPLEVLETSGIDCGDLVCFSATDGRIVMEAVTDISDYVCDGDCDHCPISQIPCNGNCTECPCANGCRRRKGVQ